jgi:hypothetical protein
MLKSNPLCLTAILALALPVLGISSVVTGVEGGASGGTTVCGTGGTSCTSGSLSAGALTQPGSTSGSYNFDITAGDGDVYDVSGTFSNTFPSTTFLGFFPTVTVVSGSAAGTNTITLDMLQDFSTSIASPNWDGTYNEKIPFDLAAGTTGEGQVFYSTNVDPALQSVGLLGPVGPGGDHYLTASKDLTSLNGDLLISDYQLTFTFPANAAPGTSVSSVPEPSQTIPLGIGLAGLLLFNLRKLIPGGSRVSQ